MPKFLVNVRIQAWGTEIIEAESAEAAKEMVEEEGEIRFCERRDADADGGFEIEIDVLPEEEDD